MYQQIVTYLRRPASEILVREADASRFEIETGRARTRVEVEVHS